MRFENTPETVCRPTGHGKVVIFRTLFGRPFVKRFALYYQTVVCLAVLSCLSCLSVCLSVTLVYCGQTVGWIKVKLGKQVGLGPGHIVLDADPALLPQRGTAFQFSTHICCGQMAGWIKMPLRTDIGLGPGHIVLDADSAPPPRGTAPNFWSMSVVAKRPDG